MQERLVMIGGTIPSFQANRLKMGFLFSHETRHRLVALAIGDLCYGADRQAYDKHLTSEVHCVDDGIIGWLKRREQASFNCFGESAKITAALRRRPAR